MEFTLTEAQQDLSGLTRSVVTELVTNDRLRELDAAEDRFDAILWKRSGLGRRPRCGPSGVGRRRRIRCPRAVQHPGRTRTRCCSRSVLDVHRRIRRSDSGIRLGQAARRMGERCRRRREDTHRGPRRGIQRRPGPPRHACREDRRRLAHRRSQDHRRQCTARRSVPRPRHHRGRRRGLPRRTVGRGREHYQAIDHRFLERGSRRIRFGADPGRSCSRLGCPGIGHRGVDRRANSARFDPPTSTECSIKR